MGKELTPKQKARLARLNERNKRIDIALNMEKYQGMPGKIEELQAELGKNLAEIDFITK